MEKEFVPYELALRMKALGFDEPCFGYYEPSKEFNYLNWEIFKDLPYLAKNSEWQDLCAAPTWQSAFRWFREKHFLSSDIIDRMSDGEKITYFFINEIKTDNKYFKTIPSKLFTNYEEAELACLEKLIEIVVQNK